MKIGFLSACLPQISLENLVKWAAESGFQSLELAAWLDVPLVGTFVGGRPDKSPPENIKEIGKVFRDILGYAGDKGVKIMIENCPMYNWVQFGVPG